MIKIIREFWYLSIEWIHQSASFVLNPSCACHAVSWYIAMNWRVDVLFINNNTDKHEWNGLNAQLQGEKATHHFVNSCNRGKWG